MTDKVKKKISCLFFWVQEQELAIVFNQSSQQGVENHIIFSQPAQGLSLLNMWQHRAVLKATGQHVSGPRI